MQPVYLQLLIQGLATGAIYGLVALGFVLIVNAVNVVNFAQGEFLMLGGFIGLTLSTLLGLPFWAALLGTIAICGLLGVVFGLSVAFAATSFFLSFFSFGGGALV